MGRATLIVILGLMGVLGILQLSLNDSSNSSTKNAVSNYSKQYARNIAHSEVNRLASYLSADSTFRSSTFFVNNVLDGYTRSTVKDTIINEAKRIVIYSIGYYNSEMVGVRVILKPPSREEIPDFMSGYALISGGNFKMSNGTIRDCCNPNKNANLHTNGNFTQTDGTIYGFAHHVGGYSDKNVLPPDNPDGLPVHKQVSSITIPAWKLSDFNNQITDTYNSNLSINGPFALGTFSNPKVIRVIGDLTLGSSTNITGYGIFVVQGKATGSGGATINQMDPNKINVAIYSELDMSFSNGSYSNILLYSNAKVKISNGFITGSVVSVGDSEMSNGGIYHKSASSVLVPSSWKTGDKRAKAIAYYE